MKTVLLFCNLGFLATSLACSLARNLLQLIIFRALQGATASGLYNLPFVVVLKVVEPERVSLFTTIIGGVFVFANLLGPILGGILASAGKWRVMFGMNIPLASLAFVLLFVAVPEEPGPIVNRAKLRRMDWIGGLLSVLFAAPIVLALQEGGEHWAWDSVVIKGFTISGGLMLSFFIVYEAFVVVKRKVDPVFPCSIFRIAPVFWLMLNALLIGATFYGAIILLPSRFQIVNNMSARSAGQHLLLMTMTVPMGALTGSMLSNRSIYGAQWVALAGSIMVMIGIVLLGFLPGGEIIPLASWFAQVHLGIGFGLLGAIALFIQKDNIAYGQIASCIGIYDMIRAMGGTIGVAICSAITHAHLKIELAKVLPADKVSILVSDFLAVSSLSLGEQRRARDAYGSVFSYQFRAIAVAAGLNVIVAMIMVWSRYFVGFSVEKRGDGAHQSWREQGKRQKEDVVKPEASLPFERPRSPAPTLPRLDKFGDISLRDV